MAFHLDFTDKAKEDISFHKNSGNKAILKKLYILIDELTIHPFSGTGKPELLKHNLSGMWSRRINKEHRLIYDLLKMLFSSFQLMDIIDYTNCYHSSLNTERNFI